MACFGGGGLFGIMTVPNTIVILLMWYINSTGHHHLVLSGELSQFLRVKPSSLVTLESRSARSSIECYSGCKLSRACPSGKNVLMMSHACTVLAGIIWAKRSWTRILVSHQFLTGQKWLSVESVKSYFHSSKGIVKFWPFFGKKKSWHDFENGWKSWPHNVLFIGNVKIMP